MHPNTVIVSNLCTSNIGRIPQYSFLMKYVCGRPEKGCGRGKDREEGRWNERRQDKRMREGKRKEMERDVKGYLTRHVHGDGSLTNS